MKKYEGIIFRSFKYSETSFIIDVFTREEGLLSYIISGVRKKNAKVSAAMVQVMNIVDIVVVPSKSGKLGRITEIKNSYVHQSLLFDFIRSSIGVFIIELSRNCIKEKESNYSLYDFMKMQLIFLDSNPQVYGVYPLYYLIALSSFLGFYPRDNYDNVNSLFNWKDGHFVNESHESQFTLDHESSIHIHKVLNVSIQSIDKLIIPKTNRALLMKVMLLYYQYHIESFKPLKSYEILKEMMSE